MLVGINGLSNSFYIIQNKLSSACHLALIPPFCESTFADADICCVHVFLFLCGEFNRTSLEYHWTIPITVLITLVPGFFTTLKTFSRDLLFFKTQLIIFLRYKSYMVSVYRITRKRLNDIVIVTNNLFSRYVIDNNGSKSNHFNVIFS